MVTDNLTLEIFRFKMRLVDAGLDISEAERATDELKKKLQRIIQSAMNDGMDKAVMAGVEKRASDFIAELKPDDERFEITTASGRKDFSIDPFSMKANLLKNAKVSKQGTRYKVIPIGKESTNKPSFLNLDQVNRAAAQKLKRDLEDRRAKVGVKNMSAKDQEFRTVTDKQPATMWQHPGFKRDMTDDLANINDNIKRSIEEQVKALMAEIESKYSQGGA